LEFTSTKGLVTTTEEELAAIVQRPAGKFVDNAPVVTAADADVEATVPAPLATMAFSKEVGTWIVCPAA
jgi:hypothetical protein